MGMLEPGVKLALLAGLVMVGCGPPVTLKVSVAFLTCVPAVMVIDAE